MAAKGAEPEVGRAAATGGWWRRHPRRSVAIAIVLTLGGLAVAKLAFDWPALPSPPPWEVVEAAAGRPGLVGDAYVYDCWGAFIDSEHLWRVQVSPDLLPALVTVLGVTELGSPDDVPAEFWRQPPYWWRPPRSGPPRCFASPKFRADARGPDGSHYLAVYDMARQALYVWHKKNF